MERLRASEERFRTYSTRDLSLIINRRSSLLRLLLALSSRKSNYKNNPTEYAR